jgi:MSHA pilin protein MshD
MRRQQGVTLVELIVAIVVVAVAVASVLGVFASISIHSADAMVRNQATAIASTYLEEIAGKSFDVLPGTGSRQNFDDVRDYDALTDNGARDQNDNAIAGLDQYQVNVSVVTDNTLPSVAAGEALRIDVRVTEPSGVVVLMSGYRTKLP